jgi:hypothetical protein
MFVDKIGLPERFDHSRQGQRIRPPRAHLERELRF